MTEGEGEPEPFRMPTGPDDGDGGDGGDLDDAPGAGESIADLIEEASRTAAEQAVQAATGEAPPDRSADVWGDTDDTSIDDVWADATEASSGASVWDAAEPKSDDVWGDPEVDRRTGPAADPLAEIGMNLVEAEEPEPFAFAVADDLQDEDDSAGAADEGDDEPTPVDDDADEAPEPFAFEAGPATTAPAHVPDHIETDDEDEPDTFAFAVEADDPADLVAGGADVVWTPQDEPDPDLAADAWEAAAPDEPVEDDDALAWGGDQPEAGDAWAAPTGDPLWSGDDEPVAVEGAPATDAGEDTDAVWAAATTEEDEAPLAESATPRQDTGWNDLEAAAEPQWTVPDLPTRPRADADDEPDGFRVDVEDDHAAATAFGAALDAAGTDEDEDDGPVTFFVGDPDEDDEDDVPVRHDLDGDDGPVHDLDDDVDLGGPTAFDPPGDDGVAATADDPTSDDALDGFDDTFGDLDAFDDLGELDDLDDLGAFGDPDVGRSGGDPRPTGAIDAPPPSMPAPAIDAPPPSMPPEAAAADERPTDDAVGDAHDDEDEDTGPVTPPGMTFSSSTAKKKKRGLFG